MTADVGEENEVSFFEGRPALVGTFGEWLLLLITLGVWFFPLWWRARSTRYRITNKRIVVETGVLSEKLEQIDLYRINDYTVERPFLQKLVGTGNLHLRTADKSTPLVVLRFLKTDVVALYEKLRRATELDKGRRGVRVVDTETY